MTGAANDQINAATTQRNVAQQGAHVFAIFGGRVWHGPLPIVSMQKVDVTAHGAERIRSGASSSSGSNSSGSRCGHTSHFEVHTGEATAFSFARASANAGN